MSDEIKKNDFSADETQPAKRKFNSPFKKRKTIYTPDPEIMEYMNSKKAAEAEHETNTKAMAEADAEAMTATETESKTKTATEIKTESETKTVAVTETEAEAMTETGSETATDTETETGIGTKTESETNAAANTYINISTDSYTDAYTETDAVESADKETETSGGEPGKPTKLGKFKLLFAKVFIPRKGDSKKQLIIKCISIFLAVAILASILYLGYYYIELYSVQSSIKNIQSIYELNRNDNSYNADGQFSKFDALKAQNDDIVGWLNIPNTDIDNPIYQASDNDFYIKHDINKHNNRYGTLFLDYRCKVEPLKLTNNLIIYGHNMREGAMLGTLDKYRELSFYKQCPLIQFDTLYEQKVYKIFAVMVVSNFEDDAFGYKYSAYRPSFATREEFLTWVQQCKDRSLYDIPVDIDPYDQIITLSTCCYDFDDARLVVMGRLVRDGETADVNTAEAAANNDVLYPRAWYEKKKKPIPQLPA